MALASIKIDKDLLNLSPNMRKGLVNFLEIAGDVTQNQIKKTKKFKDRTGNLRVSILRQKVNERGLFVLVQAGMLYGVYLNDGTKWIQARKFMEEGLEKASGVFERIMVRSLDKTM
jgi:hypothetical protein